MLRKPSLVQAEAGFTLIEMLVALAVFAIVMAVAVLTIPNHDDRYWRDNLDQLVSSLNMAQDESAMSGMTMVAQIDGKGWRFFVPGTVGVANTSNAGTSSSTLTLGGGVGSGMSGSNVANNVPTGFNNFNGLMPDVYQAKNWYKPVDIAPLQLTLGGEQVTEVLQIPIRQVSGINVRQAILIRNRNGRFSWNE
jgi:prepilin-type N-terminal cleavage/methylation domain-containing protein